MYHNIKNSPLLEWSFDKNYLLKIFKLGFKTREELISAIVKDAVAQWERKKTQREHKKVSELESNYAIRWCMDNFNEIISKSDRIKDFDKTAKEIFSKGKEIKDPSNKNVSSGEKRKFAVKVQVSYEKAVKAVIHYLDNDPEWTENSKRYLDRKSGDRTLMNKLYWYIRNQLGYRYQQNDGLLFQALHKFPKFSNASSQKEKDDFFKKLISNKKIQNLFDFHFDKIQDAVKNSPNKGKKEDQDIYVDEFLKLLDIKSNSLLESYNKKLLRQMIREILAGSRAISSIGPDRALGNLRYGSEITSSQQNRGIFADLEDEENWNRDVVDYQNDMIPFRHGTIKR